MSKGYYEKKQCSLYEWSFYKPKTHDKSVTALSNTMSTPSHLPPIGGHTTGSKQHTNDTHQHIPYSGPTLWNPRFHLRSPDKFLTLTPLRSTKKPTDSSLPVISITPRRGSREFSFLEGYQDQGSLPIDVPETHIYSNSKHDTSDLTNYLPTNDNEAIKGFVFPTKQRKKNTERISMFPDVYAIVKSPRRTEKHNAKLPTSKVTPSKEHGPSTVSSPKQVKYKNNGLGCVPSSSLSIITNNGSTSSLSDKNIQDHGTLYSSRQYAFYARLAREPSVLIPPPVGFRYVFPKNDNRADEANKSKTQNEASKAQYDRNCLKDRRSYIRWNVHRAKTRKILDCDNNIMQHNSQTRNSRKDEQLRAISKTIQSLPRDYADCNRKRSSNTGNRIAAQFCDVLGQQTCQRCREFYNKNFDQPAKESPERIRTVSPLSRENTLVLPTVGLQKVVIRVKGEHGRMEIATEDVNKGLL